MDKQELIEKYELELKDVQLKFGSSFKTKVFEEVLRDLKQLDEPQKPVVKQFVADWIERIKKELSLREAMSQGYAPHEVDSWLREMDQDGACLNQDLFARAWLDSYEIEKEKRYLVKIIGIKDYYSYLNYRKEENGWTVESKMEVDTIRTSHTRKELEQAGFGWVFDCPGVEVEEVE